MNSEVKEVLEQRGESYGDFRKVSKSAMGIISTLSQGEMWHYLDNSAKTSLLMVAMKLARIINGGLQKDSLLDIQGYIELILKNSVDIKEAK